jgi:transposase
MDDQLLQGKFRVTLEADERESLTRLVKTKKTAARRIVRARILLLADEGELGPGKLDTEIAEALDCGVRTIERVRKKFVTLGLEAALSTKSQPPRPEKIKIQGPVEEHMIEIAKSDPPEGRSHWTVQLIADQLVALGCVETVGREAVRVALKKRGLPRGL